MIKVYIIYQDGPYPYKLMLDGKQLVDSASKENIEKCRRLAYNKYYDTVSQTTQQ